MGLRSVAILMLGLTLIGCSSVEKDLSGNARVVKAIPQWEREILEHPDRFEFLTLSPWMPSEEGAGNSRIIGEFHNHGVLGRAEVKDLDLQRRLVAQLFNSIAESNEGGTWCFQPHHAIHAEKDGKTVDVLVCFICTNLYVFPEGEQNSISLATEHLTAWRDAPRELGLPESNDAKSK